MTGGIHRVDGGGFADLNNAGGTLRKLGIDKIKVTDRGIGVVENHLSRFARPDGAPWGHNQAMIGRLKEISSGKLKATAEDLNFYAHELRESVRLRRLGSTSGPVNPSHYLNSHYATLREYGIPFENHGSYLYTENALNMMFFK